MNSVGTKSVLASEGGTPVRSEPFSSWPCYSPQEIDAVVDVLRSGRVNYHTGEEGKKFEIEFAKACNSAFAVAVMNGTVALELALYSLGIGPGDEVIVPSRTFLATASCVIQRGARPVFADIDPDSQNITGAAIRAVMSSKTKAIIVVHHAGWPCEMDEITTLAAEFKLKIVEDCAQAQGATYRGRPVGSFGNMAAFSFCQDKISSTGGEGGMLVTNSKELWESAWSFKDHGKSFDALYTRQHPPGFRWLHESIGTNWRMTEMQAALGRVQLRTLAASVTARGRNAGILSRSLSGVPALRLTIPPAHVHHAYYKYYFFVRPERIRQGWSRNRIQEAILAEGIPCIVGGCSEIYLEKAFREDLRPAKRMDVAKELGETALMLQVHPTLTDEELSQTSEAILKVMEVASA